MFLTSLLSLNIWPAREEKDEPFGPQPMCSDPSDYLL